MAPSLFRRIKDENIEFVDLMYTDLLGAWHHVAVPADRFDDRLCEQGVGVDGSSVTGFRKAKSGDMVLIPDVETSFVHPFAARPTLCVVGDLVDVDAHEGFSRDPRFVAHKAARYLKAARRGEESRWLPELEFYLFDTVGVWGRPGHAGYRITSSEASTGRGRARIPEHAPQRRGYHAAMPEDTSADLRAEMCATLQGIGVPIKYHHHEVGPAGQVEIELNFMPLVKAADAVALGKWVIRNLADRAGLVATFMPKPLHGEAGSGLHFHQYLAKGDVSSFHNRKGDGPLSQIGRWYVGGLLEHGRALAAITSPSTNSYKRLVPGFEAPVRLSYSVGNRTAAIRVPGYANTRSNVRIEYRPPDATCNPHLAVAAMVMAGLDGIKRRIDPGEPLRADLFHMPLEQLMAIPALPRSLGEAIDALERDHEFLMTSGVFTDDLLETWIALKRQEETDIAERPHPREFELYLGA